MADVAVVIPCHNGSQVVGRALASVVAQSDPPREIVVVDDGSDDRQETAAIVAAARPSAPVTLLSLEKNRGAAAARNRGIAGTTAPLIAFLDADDVWHPRKLELQCEVMRRQRLVMSGHAYIQQLPGDGFPDQTLDGARAVGIGLGAFVARNPFHTPTVMVERAGFVGFDEALRRNEDYKAWVLMCARAKGRIGFVDAALAGGFKLAVGVGGLSAAVREMHESRIAAVRTLRREDAGIPRWFVSAALMSERLKYPLRVARVSLRRRLGGSAGGR